MVTLINIPSDRASIPFDEDNGAENISWKRATTFSSDFMVLRILDAWGWCTGTTQRDGMGREEGGGFRMGNTCIPVADSF